MATYWTEQFNPEIHRNHMWGSECDVPEHCDLRLDPRLVYFIRVCSFTFEFHSIGQIKQCLGYYNKKIHATSILSSEILKTGTCGGDHGETQRWYERLPQKLLKESKRKKVVIALEHSLNLFMK
jgi:hypothetical protein